MVGFLELPDTQEHRLGVLDEQPLRVDDDPELKASDEAAHERARSGSPAIPDRD